MVLKLVDKTKTNNADIFTHKFKDAKDKIFYSQFPDYSFKKNDVIKIRTIEEMFLLLNFIIFN